MKADSESVKAAKAATKSYANAANAIRSVTPINQAKLDDIGLPHSHAWNAILTTTLAAMKAQDNAECKKAVEILDAHIQQLSKGTEGYSRFFELQMQVRYCGIKKTWNSRIVKLEVHCVRGTTAHAAWCEIMKYHAKYEGAKIRQGAAPRGNLEREVQNALDRMGMSNMD
eukprot:TRINITY_DN66071_c0_g1_i1.p2 TRINITY_DN66071_c0_g1~~TRINITY_DN66071_c0_g1_i1.p2  ORF type:complete len:184 (-),score=41.61 TRINITY_DN66071_c0_g1_i1:74-583(-)